MDNDFDPYYKWLGIPPRDQPPHHYRLLGIEVFEEDRDVIDAAANRVMGYLKDLAVGDEAEYSQKLLNEVSRARLCLLNKKKKTTYDKQLRSELEDAASATNGQGTGNASSGPPALKSAPPAAPPPPASRTGVPPGLNLHIEDTSTAARLGRGGKRHRHDHEKTQPSHAETATEDGDEQSASRSMVPVIAVVAGLLLLLGGVGIAAIALSGGDDDEQVTSADDTDLESDPQEGDGNKKPNKADRQRPADRPTKQPTDRSRIPSVRDDSGEEIPIPGISKTSGSGETTRPFPNFNGETSPKPAADDPFVEIPPDNSGLPVRDDLVNPDMSGNDTSTESPFIEIAAKTDPSPSTGNPTIPGKLPIIAPFDKLPTAVTLPKANDASNSPLTIGPVGLGAEHACKIELLGGDQASDESVTFSACPFTPEPTNRHWELLLKEGESEGRIGRLSIDESANLVFLWESSAASRPAAENLCNCALALSAGDVPTHHVALREPVSVAAILVDLGKLSSSGSLVISIPPDADSIHFEARSLTGVTAEFNSPPSATADKGSLTVAIAEGSGLVALDVNSRMRRTTGSLDLTIKPQIAPVIAGSGTAEMQVKAAAAHVGRAMLGHNNKESLLAKASGLSTAERNSAQAFLTQEKAQLTAIMARLTELLTPLDAANYKIELGLRVYADFGDTQVDLVHVGNQTLPSPPVTDPTAAN